MGGWVLSVNYIAIAIWNIKPMPHAFQRIYKGSRPYGSDTYSYTVHKNTLSNIDCIIVLF